ncbi:MAG: penicillin acylase family protein [Alphaproteobacteria bacterium]|nr:penicillin acylase family protein [Alphaproteobacteria bacterium]
MGFLRGLVAFLATLVAAALGIAVLGLAAVVLVFAYDAPVTGGEASIPSLGEGVTVVRDTHGVPHIFAGTRNDAYRALGFVHAQDRFFQMEFARRTAAGRLAEVVGPPGLRGDRFMRTLGVHRLAEATIENLSPEARAAVQAYTDGVNAWIDWPERRRPPEMLVLGIKPEPWRPADSAAWVRLMALLLSGDWRSELLRARLAHDLTPDQLRDLWPDEPEDAPTTVTAFKGLAPLWGALADAVPGLFLAASASNEWVVSGDRSASGKPLLANDPHLGLSAPGMWHLARIVTPDFEASGGALPGQPFFMVGQNGHMSWGLTTTHADTQDLFIERIDPENPDRYLTPDGAKSFETRIEEIAVRWSEPERMTVRSTRHGPVISDLSEDAARLAGDGHVVALAFAALRDDDGTANAVYGMNSARTPEAFLDAARSFDSPMQNIAYAHTGGDFGVIVAGRLPLRKGAAGNRPVPGWTGEHDWRGFVPFEQMPQSQNPRSGMIVNANNRVAPRSYPHLISNDWPPGFRAERIEEMLAQAEQHTSDTFEAIQTDVRSLGALALVGPMLDVLPADALHRNVADLLADWDGEMAMDRPEPLVYAAWASALRARLIDDELGAFADNYRGLRTRVIVNILARRPQWCDDISTDAAETCADTVSTALEDAVDTLRAAYGDDPEAWRWGDAHAVTFAHPLLRFVRPLAGLLSDPLPSPGGDHTVNRGTYFSAGGGLFPHVHGAGLRAVFDMSEPGAARYMIAPGQSERLSSPHYRDLAMPWRDGRYIVLQGELETLRSNAGSLLTLTP